MYKRKTFKVSSLLLVVCMLVQLIGVQVSAATQEKVYDSLDMKITFKLISSWEGGYNAEISINNPTDVSYEDWALEMVTGDKIANMWNAGLTEKEAGKYQVTNLGYNQDVKAGKTVTFGYTAASTFTEYPEIKALKKQYVKVDASKYSVDYKVNSDWGSGANAEIAISNKSDANMAEWKLTFAYAGEITNIWNAKILNHENGVYVITGNDYNQNLNAGTTLTAGFTIGSGSKDLTVSDTVLEEYDYVSEEIIDDDNHETLNELIAFCDTEYVYIDGQGQTVYIYAISEEDDIVVNLYEESIGLIGEMKDDGNYSVSGDDMSGDGILSIKYVIPTSTSKSTVLSFYASDGKNESERVQLEVLVPPTEKDIEEMIYVEKAINDVYNSVNTPSERYEVVSITCDKLLADGYIDSYKVSEDKTYITIIYNCGLEYVIGFYPFDTNTNGYSSKLPVANNQLDFVYETIQDNYISDNYILANLENIQLSSNTSSIDAIFVNTCESSTYTYDTLEASNRESEFFDMADILSEKGVSVTKYPSCTIDTLYYNGSNKLAGKEIICIMGHGNIMNGKPVIWCTNDIYDTGKYTQLIYTKAITHYQGPFQTGDGVRSVDCYYINPRFFSDHIGNISNSFVSLLVCYSYGTGSTYNTYLAKAFCDKGANTVTCYANSVNTLHANQQLSIYLASLIAGGTSLSSYRLAKDKWGYQHEDMLGVVSTYILYSNDGIVPEEYPDGSLPTKIVNGNFENNDKKTPKYWTLNGDVRVVTKLGKTKASNKFMAFISTGVGSTSGTSLGDVGGQQGSVMSQKVECHNNGLSFWYDVFSEEPMEYVGSSFDDKFIVQITDLSNNQKYTYNLESINKSTWVAVSKVNFDGGDSTTFHTEKEQTTLQIPDEVIGKNIEISFIVCDVGDSAYDTAVVIDNVELIDLE